MISSKSNSKIKYIKKLMSSAKERRRNGVFVVEGLRIVREVPEELLAELYVSESLVSSGRVPEADLPKAEIVTDEVFRFLSDTVTPQGILAIVKKPSYSLDLSYYKDRARILLLDDIQDPGNLGTILRTAEAAGTDLVILSEGCADLFNPKVIRSTMGSIFRVPFLTEDPVTAIPRLKEAGISVYGAALEGAVDFRSVTFPEKTAIVIGNEGNGISSEVLDLVDEKIKIPMEGKVESLNAAVSTAILLYLINMK